MILLVVVAFFMLAGSTLWQFKNHIYTYHHHRILVKEEQIKTQLSYLFNRTKKLPKRQHREEYLLHMHKDEIYQIANVQGVNFNLYDIHGNFLVSSQAGLSLPADTCLSDAVLSALTTSLDKRFWQVYSQASPPYQSSYSYITDSQFKPILILGIPYFEHDMMNEELLQRMLYSLVIVYALLLIAGILTAYLTSKFVTKSLQRIEYTLKKTSLLGENQKIYLDDTSSEISQLVGAYNNMVEQLEVSKKELSKSEREKAWREVARQIAHEIKNPLTPMRLTIQSFQRKFNPTDPQITDKLAQYSSDLIEQIDALAVIASAFSEFASMPAQQKEYLNVNEVALRVVNIFHSQCIVFSSPKKEIWAYVDRNQLNRILTNLLKNAQQATEDVSDPQITLFTDEQNGELLITVSDNGSGIKKEDQERIFTPHFTTKTTGMGLGLAMVKNMVLQHQGSIHFKTEEGKGTQFFVRMKNIQK